MRGSARCAQEGATNASTPGWRSSLSGHRGTGRDGRAPRWSDVTRKWPWSAKRSRRVWPGRAHLVLLLGEAGVGKSRLAEELAAKARSDYCANVLEGRCVPYGEANAWWPIAKALRQAYAITPSDTAEVAAARCQAAVADATELAPESPDVQRIVDGLLHVIGHETRLANVDPVRAMDEDQRALTVFLEALARSRPLVLAVSELHWADDGVLTALDRLLDTMGSLPFLVLATARPELAGRWRPRPSCRRHCGGRWRRASTPSAPASAPSSNMPQS